jgi:hypothetical protein
VDPTDPERKIAKGMAFTDPYHFDADPDQHFLNNAKPDPTSTLIRIRIRIFSMMRK